MKTILRSSITAMLLAGTVASAQPVRSQPDWLVDPSPFKAHVTQDKATGELVLENGLLRRVIRLAPNAATVDFRNLSTGAQLMRSVRPEATVTLDGTIYPVGGLAGQPVHNYLNPDWLKTMTSPPGAYVFDRVELGVTRERFPWKKRLEWMPRDMPWPPPGKSATLYFRPPAAAPVSLGGPVVLEDDFAGALKPQWAVKAAKGFDRASFVNEGKAGEIMAGQAMAVCAEHAWPAGAQSVEVLMDSGDDRSAAWGPGLALVTPQGLIRFITRPGEGSYEAAGKVGGRFDGAKPCRLRVRLEAGVAVLEAAQEGQPFTTLGSHPCSAAPTALRVGKLGLDGSGVDAGADKTVIRCHISKVTWRGAEQNTAASARVDLPEVAVHYEIYDGIPLLCKWVTLTHRGEKSIRLNTLTTEILAAVEPESYVGRPIAWMTPRPDIHVESDYAMAGDGNSRVANRVVRWGSDPLYGTQVHYDRQTPCLLECRLERGPDQEIAPSGTFESFRVFELLQDGGDRERTSLAQRRMYRTIAPYVTQSPILMHVRGSDPASVRTAIDQCAEVGFQMVIMTFGSGFNYESRDKAYQARYKELADYAHSKGIALGGYSLLASRGAGNGEDNTKGAPTSFGVMPCMGAKWGIEYLAQLKDFITTSGLDVLEHDGSYPGDECAATTHPGHRGLNDSQWVMWRAVSGLYRWCCANGVYLNIPDWWILNGAPKTYMGYRETNWSLPREYQEIIERQNCFDGTWEKTPSMGWMFVPLTQYHGGGAAATIEPLKDHLAHYETRLANLFGYGVQACYRGPRLYDTDITKSAVMHWTSFYRAHRTVLNGDIIHLRRADGRDWDGILHVDPQGTEKALAMFYNPLPKDITRDIRVPLHYAGLTGKVWVATEVGKPQRVTLDANEEVVVQVTIPAGKRTWAVFSAKP